MRIVKFRILSARAHSVYTEERRRGVVEYDDTIPGDAITRLITSFDLCIFDILELEFSKSYGYVKFKLDSTGKKVVTDGSIIYEAKN